MPPDGGGGVPAVKVVKRNRMRSHGEFREHMGRRAGVLAEHGKPNGNR